MSKNNEHDCLDNRVTYCSICKTFYEVLPNGNRVEIAVQQLEDASE